MEILKVCIGENQAELTGYIQKVSDEMKNTAVRPAILVLPGGGYHICSDREAEPVALAYMAHGFNAFVLNYSVGRDKSFEQALCDAEAALRYIRANAPKLHIDPKKVAVAGFSAGGHLAACMGTFSTEKADAMILGYPVILEEFGSVIGKKLPSVEQFVTKDTAPAFIFATQGDTAVPIEHTTSFVNALAKAKIPFESHVFLTGDHALSLATTATADMQSQKINRDVSAWLSMSVRFLEHIFDLLPKEQTEELKTQADTVLSGIDEPIEKILRNVKIRTILEQYLGENLTLLEQNPMIKSFTLEKLAKYKPDMITGECLEKVKETMLLEKMI